MFFRPLETERLILKNIDVDDRDFIYSQFSDDVVTRYLFDAEPLTDMGGADEIISSYVRPEPRTNHRWILVRKMDNAKMGTCGFHCWDAAKGVVEVGYDLKEQFWGQGYMAEAIRTIFAFAQSEMRVKEIRAVIYPDNPGSVRLAERLGFVLTGSKCEVFRGKEYPHNVYSLYLT